MKSEEGSVYSQKRNKMPGSKWNPFNSTAFCICFSVVVAIITWFVVSAEKIGTAEQPLNLQDVEIALELSDAAINGGLRIFDQNELTADVTIRASSAIKGQLTKGDVTVTGFFSPSSTKTSGTGLNTATVTLRATKNNKLADYDIIEISPSEITVQYDRSSETTLPLTDEIKRSAKSGYMIGDPIYSESSVVVSGPESYVNLISYAAVKTEVTEQLSKDKIITEPITLYEKEAKVIKDYKSLFLDLSVDTVKVTLPVLAKKTVPLQANHNNKPIGFSDSRITVTPETVDIAAPEENIGTINKITLEEVIQFSEVSFDKRSFEVEIPISSNVQNVNNTEKATVSFNLNGFKEVSKTTTNISLLNAPSDNVSAATKSMNITIIGSEAQVAKLTGDMINVSVDLTGWKADSGNMSLPAKVTITGADTCWAVGEYTISVDLGAQNAVLSGG